MSVHAQPTGVSTAGLRAAAGRLAVVWPVLITALLYLAVLGAQLAASHGDPTVFVQFGRLNLAATHPPAGAPIVPSLGYDGQLYWLQAADPLLRHPSTILALSHVSSSYSLQRVAYPALAWLLAGGHRGALAWSLLVVNLLAVLGLTAGFSVLARRRGWNPAWALVVGLSPGLLVSTSRDLSDVLATAGMLGGLMCWSQGRSWRAGGLLTVAVLSREPMALAVAAVGVDLLARCLRALPSWSGAWGQMRRRWPALVLPSVAYFAWRAYARGLPLPHSTGGGSAADTPLFPPFNDLRVAAEQAVHAGAAAGFILPYLALTAAGVLASVWLLRRGLSAASVTAALYALLVLPVVFLTDEIALTRYTMPMFLALLLAGLEQRSRSALAVAAGSSAMIVLLPLLGG